MFEFLKRNELILFYSSRRGGSTLLAQILEAEPKVGYVDQPFDLWKPTSEIGRIIASHLPKKDMSQFFELNSEERMMVKHYLNKIYKQKLQELCTDAKAKQLVLKIVNAHGLIDELPKLVPSKTVMLLRHPFSQALSVIRNGWGTCERPFLESKAWSSTYLTVEQRDFANNIVKAGIAFDKAVLNWSLEWVYPIHFSKTTCLKLYYEDLVLNGPKAIKTLYDYLGFKNTNDALEVLNRPSKSSTFSTSNTINNIASGNKIDLLSSWRTQLTESQQARGQDILTMFHMNMYSKHSDLPVL